jgi:DNA relaxase NicK
MALDKTVPAQGDEQPPRDDFYGWDWSSTTHDASEGCVDVLLHRLGAKNVVPGKGLQGWSQSVKAFDGDGYALGSVYFGGGRDDVHVVSTSSVADRARPLVTDFGNAKTARVDTRVDTLLPWDQLADVLNAAAETYGSQITFMESKERGVSKGRTLYLGAPSSRIRVRVYEKHLESPGEYAFGTNRVEVQLRPHSAVKSAVSSWSPGETFCASRTTRDLAERLGHTFTPEATLRIKPKAPTLDETMQSMARQYGSAVARFLEHTGGDIGRVLSYLTDMDEHAMTPERGNGVPLNWVEERGVSTLRTDAEAPF